MSRIISIANQKGGVGKTTTSINLSSCLANLGKKVLLIDLDPQGNATSSFGINKNEEENTIYEIIINEDFDILTGIKNEIIENLSLIPSNVNLSGAEIELSNISNYEIILRRKLDKIKDDYDYIIIDCPPALGILTINALTCSDSVLIPVQCEYYALEGLTQLLQTIELVEEILNPSLRIEGIVFTMFDSRNKLSQDVINSVKENLRYIYVFDTVISRNVRLAEAPSFGLPINMYDPNSTGTKNYMSLAKELSKNE